jgi:hypothetical protein
MVGAPAAPALNADKAMKETKNGICRP